MPWTCTSCTPEIKVRDEISQCPGCGRVKTTWTAVIDHTRKMVIPRKRFLCMRGETPDPVESLEAYDSEEWEATDYVYALPKSEVRRLLDENKLPAPNDVLTVRMHPKRAKDLTLNMTVLFDKEAPAELAFAGPASTPDQSIDSRFILVYDEEDDEPPVELPGVQVIDVTELTNEEGFAPRIEVVCLKRPERLLEVVDSRFVLRLESPLKLPIPEVEFRATYSDGTEFEGKVNREGIAKLNAPEGEIEITYLDPDDLVAKVEAGRALRAIEQKDRDMLAFALRHPPEVDQRVQEAYDEYFNELSGKGFLEDLYAAFTDPMDILHLEIQMVLGGIKARGTVRGELREVEPTDDIYSQFEEEDIYAEIDDELEAGEDDEDDQEDELDEALDDE